MHYLLTNIPAGGFRTLGQRSTRGVGMTALPEGDDLCIAFPSRQGPVGVVRGMSFSPGRERLGIVGESGSGKSQTGRVIPG
jgi:hypothetical protein